MYMRNQNLIPEAIVPICSLTVVYVYKYLLLFSGRTNQQNFFTPFVCGIFITWLHDILSTLADVLIPLKLSIMLPGANCFT